MSGLDRRTLLMHGGAATLATLPPFATAHAQTVVTRRSIATLAANDPIIQSYRVAVRAMKALPTSDPRNWTRQAQIHNNSCPHGNWFFLPWHRAYLVAFERICRQLSGNANFALPYWDWTANPQLPAFFASPTHAGQPNPLFNSTRSSQTVTIPANVAGNARMTTLLAETSFEVFGSTRPTNQNSTAASWQRRGGIKGPFESGPHDQVHVRINGDMVSLMSPIDPIFWLHHCNIDRLWERWNAMGRVNTSNALWRTFAFNGQFVNPAGASGTTPFNVAINALLGINALGYRYVASPLVAALTAAPVLARTIDLASPAQTARVQVGEPARINVPLSLPVRLGAPQAAALARTRPFPSTMTATAQPIQTPTRIVAIIRDVEPPASGNTDVRVFVNCPYLSPETSTDDRHYAGSFTFFGSDHHAHEGKPSFLIDLTETVIRLRRADLAPTDNIDVQLMPVPIPGVPPAGEFKPGSVEIAFF